MAITPTVMIAASGMLTGAGIGTNSAMSSAINQTLNNPLIAAYVGVTTNANVNTVSGLSSTLSSLSNAFSSTRSVSTQVPAQAALMAPNVATFITLHSAATSFSSGSADYGAALAQFSTKSFGDLGIGVSGFVDTNSGGLTSLLPGFSAVINQATTTTFENHGNTLSASTLAQGQASVASSVLGDSLKSVGIGLSNFGTLFDFSNPQTIGYQGLLISLQKQGLADSVGINSAVSVAGFNPANPLVIPDSVLRGIYGGITDSNLQKIISQTGAAPVGTVNTLNDLLDPSVVMPSGAISALGLKSGAGVAGLKVLANSMTNIGVPMDNITASKLLGSIQTKIGPHLANLTSPVPQSITSTLSPLLGKGNSPFGTPQLMDMMGSLAGIHTPQFTNINSQFNIIGNSTVGQSLTVALQNMNVALTTNSGTAGAYSSLQTAVSNFNTQANTTNSLTNALSSVVNSTSVISAQLSNEINNFALAGINLSSPPASPSGSGQILSFADKLHMFGVDKQQLGHNDVLNGAATNDLTGDAIKAALLEGKNISAMSSVGKPATTVSNTTVALAASNTTQIDSLIQAFETAKSIELAAKNTLAKANSSTFAAATIAYNTAHDSAIAAQNNLLSAASSAGGITLTKANAVIAQYLL